MVIGGIITFDEFEEYITNRLPDGRFEAWWAENCTMASFYARAFWEYKNKEMTGLKEEKEGLLKLTRLIDEHPEDYDGPCECQSCMAGDEI